MAQSSESSHKQPTLKQIFFDCDNTLVSTEEVAIEAVATVVNRVLADQQIDKEFDNVELLTLYFGKTAGQMIGKLEQEYKFSLSAEQRAAYALYEEDLVIELIRQKPIPCEGVKGVLRKLHESKKYKLAVVSSSPIRRIRAALEAADIAHHFEHDQVFSAKSSLPTPKSKPDPAIYRWAMEKNGVTADECVAFEDSRSGARSAIGAGITCIAYVGAYQSSALQDQVASTLRDEGCKMVMSHYDQLFACLGMVENELKAVVVG